MLPRAVERFLEGVQSGNWDGIEQHLTPDVVYDATVPGWRYQYRGPSRVAQEYRQEWTGHHPWTLTEQHMALTADGAVIDFEARGQRPASAGQPSQQVGVRIANIFRIEEGRIAEHRCYCGGEWDEDTHRRIAAEAPTVDRRND